MTILAREDKFVVSGKRLNYYHNSALTTNHKPTTEECYPINVEFNLYFNVFVIQTKQDIRIYDGLTGKLKKVFNEIQDANISAEINCLCFGGKQRKFFIGDNAGLIRQFNMKDGVLLKEVNSLNEIQKSEFASKF